LGQSLLTAFSPRIEARLLCGDIPVVALADGAEVTLVRGSETLADLVRGE